MEDGNYGVSYDKWKERVRRRQRWRHRKVLEREKNMSGGSRGEERNERDKNILYSKDRSQIREEEGVHERESG